MGKAAAGKPGMGKAATRKPGMGESAAGKAAGGRAADPRRRAAHRRGGGPNAEAAGTKLPRAAAVARTRMGLFDTMGSLCRYSTSETKRF
jgi:hypothetical protein